MGALAAASSAAALMSVAGGLSGQGASRDEAGQLSMQADIALQESQRDAMQRRRQVRSFREEQAQMYNNSGVLLEEGTSPMAVLADTIRKGDEEVDAILKRGQSMSELYRRRASQVNRGGVSNLLSSVLGAGAGLTQTWILGRKLGLFGNSSSSASASTAQPLPPVASPNGRIGGP